VIVWYLVKHQYHVLEYVQQPELRQGSSMKRIGWILAVFFAMVVFAGCMTSNPIPLIVTSGAVNITQMGNGTGLYNVYTETFQVKNPSNQTFTHFDIQIAANPMTLLCHPQTKIVTVPAVLPHQMLTEEVSFSEFSNATCQYAFSFDIFPGNQQ